MLRWLLVIVVTLLLFNALRPWLEKFGLGKLPGDLNFRFRGRDWSLPITTTLLLSFTAMLIGQLL